MFTTQPTLDHVNKTLAFGVALDKNSYAYGGGVPITVMMIDDGGNYGGGVNIGNHTFWIIIMPINDPPFFENIGDVAVSEGVGWYTRGMGWATPHQGPPEPDELAQASFFSSVTPNKN